MPQRKDPATPKKKRRLALARGAMMSPTAASELSSGKKRPRPKKKSKKKKVKKEARPVFALPEEAPEYELETFDLSDGNDDADNFGVIDNGSSDEDYCPLRDDGIDLRHMSKRKVRKQHAPRTPVKKKKRIIHVTQRPSSVSKRRLLPPKFASDDDERKDSDRMLDDDEDRVNDTKEPATPQSKKRPTESSSKETKKASKNKSKSAAPDSQTSVTETPKAKKAKTSKKSSKKTATHDSESESRKHSSKTPKTKKSAKTDDPGAELVPSMFGTQADDVVADPDVAVPLTINLCTFCPSSVFSAFVFVSCLVHFGFLFVQKAIQQEEQQEEAREPARKRARVRSVFRSDGTLRSRLRPVVQNVVAKTSLDCDIDLTKVAWSLRNAEYNPRKFSAAVMRIRNPKATGSIFASGKLVVTGAKSVDEARQATRKFVKLLHKVGFTSATLNRMEVQNIVGNFDLRVPIRLEALAEKHYESCTYEPELFSGVTYRLANPKVSVIVFVSGKIVFTGARTVRDIDRAFQKIVPILHDFRKGSKSATQSACGQRVPEADEAHMSHIASQLALAEQEAKKAEAERLRAKQEAQAEAARAHAPSVQAALPLALEPSAPIPLSIKMPTRTSLFAQSRQKVPLSAPVASAASRKKKFKLRLNKKGKK
ncbi:MAG: hypothetical protein MHM6MM_006920 [Cercozoa sp. M6MM]